MTPEMFTTSVLVGLIAGWLAGIVMKGGGNGLIGDISLGLGGSTMGIWIFGSWIFQALGVSPEAGWFAMVVIAFVGAASVIVAQRKVWPGHA